MPNQGDRNRVEPAMTRGTDADLAIEPGIREGTNASLLSSSGTPISDTGARPGGLMGRVNSVADTGKSRLAGSLHDLGDRIEHTGRDLESGNILVRPVGRALDSTGNALESGARYLRTTDIDVIGDDVVDGIRSHPLVSAGLAVGCGWLLGRMFGSDEESHEDEQRASERREHEEHEDHDVSEGPSTMDRVKGRMADMLAGGVASFAARQVRNRIAGR